MTLPLDTDIDAMASQAISGQKKSIAIQRLGTGFRINTAKDDAAGLASSESMSSTNNTTSTASDFKDADYAIETTAFSSASVLQQAGVAVLAEANQIAEKE